MTNSVILYVTLYKTGAHHSLIMHNSNSQLVDPQLHIYDDLDTPMSQDSSPLNGGESLLTNSGSTAPLASGLNQQGPGSHRSSMSPNSSPNSNSNGSSFNGQQTFGSQLTGSNRLNSDSSKGQSNNHHHNHRASFGSQFCDSIIVQSGPAQQRATQQQQQQGKYYAVEQTSLDPSDPSSQTSGAAVYQHHPYHTFQNRRQMI